MESENFAVKLDGIEFQALDTLRAHGIYLSFEVRGAQMCLRKTIESEASTVLCEPLIKETD